MKAQNAQPNKEFLIESFFVRNGSYILITVGSDSEINVDVFKSLPIFDLKRTRVFLVERSGNAQIILQTNGIEVNYRVGGIKSIKCIYDCSRKWIPCWSSLFAHLRMPAQPSCRLSFYKKTKTVAFWVGRSYQGNKTIWVSSACSIISHRLG